MSRADRDLITDFRFWFADWDCKKGEKEQRERHLVKMAGQAKGSSDLSSNNQRERPDICAWPFP